MKKTICLTLAVLVTSIAYGKNQMSIKEFMIEALKSDKPIQMEMNGEIADEIKSKTGSSAPVIATARKISQYKDRKECGTIELIVSQDGAKTTQGQAPIRFGYHFTLCEDGSDPTAPPKPQ